MGLDGSPTRSIEKCQAIIASIRRKARQALLGGRSGGHVDLRAALEAAEGSKGPTGRLPISSFRKVLQQAGFVLDEEEQAFVMKRFADHKGVVDYARFYNALDISVPNDYDEPDHFMDQLPQPYRRIMKVLEEDVFEGAWRAISKRHPEVANTLYTQPVDYFKQDFERACYPTSWVEDETGPVTAVALDETGVSLFVGTLLGKLMMVSTETGRVTYTSTPFPDMRGAIAGLAVSGAFTPAAASSPSIQTSNANQNPLSSTLALELGIRASNEVLHLAAFVNTTPNPDAEQQSGGLLRAMSKPGLKPQTTSASVTSPSAPASRVAVIKVSGESLKGFAMLNTTSPVLSVCISRDGALLAVTTRDGLLAVYKVPPPPEIAPSEDGLKSTLGSPVAASNVVQMARITEGADIVFRVAEQFKDMPLPFFRLEPPPPPHSTAPSATSSATPAAVTHQPSIASTITTGTSTLPKPPPLPEIHFLETQTRVMDHSSANAPVQTTTVTSGMVVWRRCDNTLQLYEVWKRPPPTDDAVASLKSPVAARKSTAKDLVVDVLSRDLMAQLVSEWLLPAAITASAMDVGRDLLVLGLASGSVVLWDLHVGAMRDALGRHEGPVAAVAIVSGRFVVTGSADRRVHVYDLCPDRSNQDSELTTELRELYDIRVPRLLGHRSDFTTPVVSIRTLGDAPICAIQDASGTMAIFDVPRAAPLGRIEAALSTGQRPVTAHELLQLHAPPRAKQETVGDSTLTRRLTFDYVAAAANGVMILGFVRDKWREEAEQTRRSHAEEQLDGSSVSDLSTASIAAAPPPDLLSQAPPVALAVYRTAGIVKDLCPAIGSIPDAEEQEVLHLYATLSPELRRKPQLPPNLHLNRQPGIDGPQVRPVSPGSRGGRSTRSRSIGSSRSGVSRDSGPGHGRTASLSSHDSQERSSKGTGSSRGGMPSVASSAGAVFDTTGVALTQENLAMFGGSGYEVMRSVKACRFLDPMHSAAKLKRERNANRQARDAVLIETFEELLSTCEA